MNRWIVALLALLAGTGEVRADAFSSTPPYTPPRTTLTATKTLWVTAAGSDANSCQDLFANGCATVQRAVNVALSAFDANGQTVIIALQSGITYTGAITISRPLQGGGVLWINGSGGQGTLTVANANLITAQAGANVFVGNVILQTTGGSGGICLGSQTNAQIAIQAGTTFGSCIGPQIDAQGFSNIVAATNYTIAGSGQSHLHSHTGGAISIDNMVVTCTGTPAFGVYFAGASWSYIEAIGTTFSGCGGVTGARFTANRNAGIRTNTNNINFFPGTLSGTLDSNAVYDNYGSVGGSPRTIASGSADTAFATDAVILWKSASGAAKAETIPACGSTGPWQPILVQDAQGDAAISNITVTPATGTINGAANKVINTAYGKLTLLCDGVSNYLVQ